MKKFVFSLQKVLDLRVFAEEQAKIALAEAISVADKIKIELAQIAEDRVRISGERSNSISINDLVVIENYIVRLDTRKEILLQELAEAQLVIEEKRKLMMEAMKERKVLSSLRDRKFEEYKKAYHKAEDEQIDDVTQPRYAMQQDD